MHTVMAGMVAKTNESCYSSAETKKKKKQMVNTLQLAVARYCMLSAGFRKM